jgi:hypothetical protein
MNAIATTGKLAPIDLALAIMDHPRRPLDFTLIFYLNGGPSLDALRAGAKSARNLYPATGSFIKGKQWVRSTEPGDQISAVVVASNDAVTAEVQTFLARPIELSAQLPVQQLVISNSADGSIKLVTRFHHTVADGLSAAMWLRHQLRVAYEKEAPVADAAPFQDVPLRTHEAPVKKSSFAHRGPSHRLWTSGTKSSGVRLWRTIELDANELRRGCRRAGGFTYNDLLATCALEVFADWNRHYSRDHATKIGLWLPINIRQQAAAGFGNGSGRIRLYACYSERAALLDKCREVRRQISWTTQHGEWAVPQTNSLYSLPRWALSPVLRCYFNRPGVDMASGVFSHVERWTGEGGEVFQGVEKIETIGQLHQSYCVVINAASHRGRTWLTFTYDPGLMSATDIERFIAMYQEKIELARQELG